MSEQLWRCDTCGTEYIADIGRCGQLQPPCDGTVEFVEQPTAQDVIDALRLALEAQRDSEELVRIVETLVAMAPETDGKRGVQLLLDMISEGALKVALT
jgi:hypothetical protein